MDSGVHVQPSHTFLIDDVQFLNFERLKILVWLLLKCGATFTLGQ